MTEPSEKPVIIQNEIADIVQQGIVGFIPLSERYRVASNVIEYLLNSPTFQALMREGYVKRERFKQVGWYGPRNKSFRPSHPNDESVTFPGSEPAYIDTEPTATEPVGDES